MTMSVNLPILKRKRATLLYNITRCVKGINDAKEGNTLDDFEDYRNRLQETLNGLISFRSALPHLYVLDYTGFSVMSNHHGKLSICRFHT